MLHDSCIVLCDVSYRKGLPRIGSSMVRARSARCTLGVRDTGFDSQCDGSAPCRVKASPRHVFSTLIAIKQYCNGWASCIGFMAELSLLHLCKASQISDPAIQSLAVSFSVLTPRPSNSVEPCCRYIFPKLGEQHTADLPIRSTYKSFFEYLITLIFNASVVCFFHGAKVAPGTPRRSLRGLLGGVHHQ
jgi:hypothetical protein